MNIRAFLPKSGPVTEAEMMAYARGDEVQVCEVLIEAPVKELPIRLYLAHHTRGPTTIGAVPSSSSAIPVLVHDDGTSIVASTRPGDDVHAMAIAAAISVMKAAWAWDERPELQIRVNSTPMVASAALFDADRRWTVQVETAV